MNLTRRIYLNLFVIQALDKRIYEVFIILFVVKSIYHPVLLYDSVLYDCVVQYDPAITCGRLNHLLVLTVH